MHYLKSERFSRQRMFTVSFVLKNSNFFKFLLKTIIKLLLGLVEGIIF